MCAPSRSWQKLKEVLQSWLQTSGEDEQMEKPSVCQELKEVRDQTGNNIQYIVPNV